MGYMTIGAEITVLRSPIWCGFRVGARAIQYGVNIAYYRNPIKTGMRLFL